MVRISPFAANYLRKRTTERMNGVCRIWTPGPPTKQQGGSYKPSVGQVKYEGPCRFWEVTAGSLQPVGDQLVAQSSSYLTIPWDAPVPEPQDWIKIVSHEDSALEGSTVNIISMFKGGGLRASRRFLVEVRDAARKDSW